MSSEEESAAPRQKASAFAAMMDDSDDSSGSEEESTAPVAKPVPVPQQKAAAAAPTPPAKAAKGKAKPGKKVGAAKADDDDDDWALLNEAAASASAASATKRAADTTKPAAEPAASAAVAASVVSPDAASEILARMGVATEDAAKGADKKKKKKKPSGKAGGGDEGDGDGAAPAAAASPAPAPAKKLTAAAKLALERQAEVKAEAERKAAAEAETARVEALLKAAEDAEEKKRLEAKERRKAKEAAKKELEAREGVTAKQKAQLALARTRLGLPAAAAAGSGDVSSSSAVSPPEAVPEGAADAAGFAQGGKKGGKASAMYADSRKGRKGGAAAAAVASEAASSDGATAAAAAAGDASSPPAAEPAPAAASAPVVLPSLASLDDWEEAADDWETVADTPTGGSPAAAAAAGTAGSPTGESASPPSSSTAPAASPPSSSSHASAALRASLAHSSASGGAANAAPGTAAAAPVHHSTAVVPRTRAERQAAALDARTPDRLRSPICVVLGHVDTGKTSLLDKIRRTNVQEGEAGGITQQIGATYFPMDRIATATDKVNKELHLEYRIPGLLIIDTPGHEQFTNLRSRGSSLCDMAVLVVDIMHGLERQTIESLNLLRQRRTPFVVALNKVDRMYGWKAMPGAPIRETLAHQPDYAVSEFETRTQGVLTQIAEQGLNAKLYYDNDNFKKNVSVVPTSAFTGEGIPDLLMLIVQLTQQMMAQRLMYSPFVQATILEVKTIDGLGTTIDVVLVNGELREGDTIVVCGMEGPIVTQIRALLTPPPLREMRVKGEYVHHKRIEAAMGVKISAQGLDKAVAGTSVLVAEPEDDIEELKAETVGEWDAVMKGFKREPVGVYVQASTLGSLEALLEYLRCHTPPVPVAGVGLGPLHKKDVVTASVMLEHKKEFATVLAFDVKVTPEARDAAEHLGVRIFTADIIYHLTDQFDAYLKSTTAAKQEASLEAAVFPVIARVNPLYVFNKRDPIVVGVDVLEGKLRLGTPLCVVLDAEANVAGARASGLTAEDGSIVKSGPLLLNIGIVTGIEHNHTAQTEAVAGGPPVAVKISPKNGESAVLFGRQFDHNHLLYAQITRESLNVLKENFRDAMKPADWKLCVKLKGLLGVD